MMIMRLTNKPWFVREEMDDCTYLYWEAYYDVKRERRLVDLFL